MKQIENTIITYSIEELSKCLNGAKSVATVGFFDGVHLGHQDLLQRLCSEARKIEAKSIIITFPEHPLTVVGGPSRKTPLLLCDKEDKEQLLARQGADFILMLTFTPELAATTGKDFAQMLHDELNTVALVMGYDNHFGSKRFKTEEETQAYVESWAIPVFRHSALYKDDIKVSSSVIRSAIKDGEFSKAWRLLGRPYSIKGTVLHGSKIGRRIKYPTANIEVDAEHQLVPAQGIFVSEVIVGDKRYGGMSYYGQRPTLGHDEKARMEVFLFDFSGDLYGKEVEILFYHYLRADIKFYSLDALAEQLKKDETDSRAFLEKLHAE
ncbi:MAG: riboflavin biosynthesis protein RibF [Porphyromonas sp.]|nr:riboflavin biosynthesis protein RibF [Porphyromonas sp.]